MSVAATTNPIAGGFLGILQTLLPVITSLLTTIFQKNPEFNTQSSHVSSVDAGKRDAALAKLNSRLNIETARKEDQYKAKADELRRKVIANTYQAGIYSKQLAIQSLQNPDGTIKIGTHTFDKATVDAALKSPPLVPDTIKTEEELQSFMRKADEASLKAQQEILEAAAKDPNNPLKKAGVINGDAVIDQAKLSRYLTGKPDANGLQSPWQASLYAVKMAEDELKKLPDKTSGTTLGFTSSDRDALLKGREVRLNSATTGSLGVALNQQA